MAKKIEKGKYPENHEPGDFEAFGPPAMENGQFDNNKIADLGSFSQDNKDSNKYYCAMVVKSRINGKWYTYFEWGRVGASNPQFQMIECASEAEAQKEYAAVCHEKNDKRGVWTTIAGLKTLTAKPGKDVYLVRQLTTRSTGLPDAKRIKYIDPNGPKKSVETVVKTGVASNSKKADPYTISLLNDLRGGTIKYAKASMADNSLPTHTAIDQGNTLLLEATKRIAIIGDDLETQIRDKELRSYSEELYKRIPKIKAVGTSDNVWILSQNNITSWQQDLAAFESALSSQSQIDDPVDEDPFQGLPLHMEWIDPKSDLGKFLSFWWPKATGNKHHGIKDMKIKNLWKIDRHGDDEKFSNAQNLICKDMVGRIPTEKPLFQPNERLDINPAYREAFQVSNTALLFHGTRSVNVKGILEKSLVLPKQLVGVVITGAMFGPGLYWADDWKKSAGYTSMPGSYWAKGEGGVKDRSAFMFAADVAIGDPHIALAAHGYTAPPNKTHSVFGMGRNHKNKGKGAVENNEWMTYQNAQSRLKYLAEFVVG